MSEWTRVCVLCSAHGRERRLESGHCCKACETGLTDALRAILRLCEMASAAIVPASSGDTGRGGYESRPAANLAAVDPELTLMPLFDGDNVGTTVLDMLESWCRAIREDRGMVEYGPWSLDQTSRLRSSVSDSWENGGTKAPGEVAASRGMTDHREG